VYAQVYGVTYELPWFVEPLKDLVFNRPESEGHLWAGFVDRIRLFCTVYDPTTGRYETDYSLFVQIAIGLMIVLSVSYYLWREFRRPRR
jgi:protein SCO1/2